MQRGRTAELLVLTQLDMGRSTMIYKGGGSRDETGMRAYASKQVKRKKFTRPKLARVCLVEPPLLHSTMRMTPPANSSFPQV